MVRFLTWFFSDKLLSNWTGRLFSMKIIYRFAKCVTVTHFVEDKNSSTSRGQSIAPSSSTYFRDTSWL
jgi:hypothetical protein